MTGNWIRWYKIVKIPLTKSHITENVRKLKMKFNSFMIFKDSENLTRHQARWITCWQVCVHCRCHRIDLVRMMGFYHFQEKQRVESGRSNFSPFRYYNFHFHYFFYIFFPNACPCIKIKICIDLSTKICGVLC